MRKKLFILLMIAIPAFLCLNSCYKDKGNYDYKVLPSLVIDTSGGAIKPEINIKQLGRLMLKPNVKYAGNSADLAYKWELYEVNPVRDVVTNKFGPRILLAETKDLDAEMNYTPTNYYLTYTVTDKSSETKQFLTIKVNVESAMSKGWLVLDEKDGSYDIEIVKSPLLLPLLEPADEGTIFNTFSLNNGSKLTNATSITQVYISATNNKVFSFTATGGYQLNQITMKSERSGGEFFQLPEATVKLEAIGNSFNNSQFMINNGGAQTGSGFKFNGRIRGDYHAAPYILYRNSGGPVLVIYDTKNRRFMQLPLFGTTFGIYPVAAENAIFDMNNIGKDIVHMENGFNNYSNFIFKDPGVAKYYMYVANLNSTAQTPIAKYEMNNCPEIAQATHFAIGSRGPVAYYAAGNKVYLYNYSGTNTATVAHTFDAAEKVTSMKVFKETDNANDNKVLVVATYNEASKAGKVYMFEASEVSGVINTVTKKEYSGFGRILDMCNKR